MTLAEHIEKRGWSKGLSEGKIEGKNEGKAEIAINLLKENTDPKFIARITGLSLEKVIQLQSEISTIN